ncbi:hypothetical protein TrRE_jg13611 [Triparma retinervis]|uniref:Uncharacterized protein n=1 Tax=Triparma retinervis TaxID=2557542 RepID=A0A9W7E3L2_9STRA|nr:hypothetical protein TrRE_jg13611 [Triparma retinervis]
MPTILKGSRVENDVTVHCLPCHIEAQDSKAPRCATSLYFKPVEVPMDEDNAPQKENDAPSEGEASVGVSSVSNSSASKVTYAAQLRGRALVGRKVVLPENIRGCELVSTDVSAMPEDGREESTGPYLAVGSTFKEVTIWGHDFAPSERENAIQLSVDWYELAAAIHDDGEEEN